MLPDAVVYAASAACEGPFRVFPRFLHCNAIEGKLKSIVDGDVALRKSNLSRLQRRAIEGACVERAIPVAERSEVMVKGLDEWLALTKSQPAASDSSVCLALLAINTAHVIRRDDSSRLTRSLLSPNGF
ncbi:hypothetical protein M885DRAFT_441152 [Pelagophyceae sp. CCMP2097]|nr:hypothetical protein M885DRAFT_441152 [Pelagophyceae sp. CCMP2097]